MYGFNELTPGTFIALIIGIIIVFIIYKLIFPSRKK